MADKAHLPQSKHVNLTLSQADELYAVVKSLANEQRLEIMSMLGARSMFVNEIAQQLDIPVSTAANHVRILEEAEVITCEQLPGVRGTMKLCHRRLDSININLIPQIEHKHASLSMSLPVGCYSFAEDIAPTCGLAGAHSAIAEDDTRAAFFTPTGLAPSCCGFAMAM